MLPGRIYTQTADSSRVAVPARPVAPTSSMREDPDLVRAERDELWRRFAAVPRVTQNAAIQFAESEKALKAIRLARDTVIERSTELSSLTGAQFDSFVAKPYHLNELALKAIGTILASRVNRR
jgi:hypothetical protein